MAAEFEWDSGNWPKCGKHGVSREEVEYVLAHRLWEIRDPYEIERRFRAVGKTDYGRYVFIVYTLRGQRDEEIMRPISARYMHDKEVHYYEQDLEKALSRFS